MGELLITVLLLGFLAAVHVVGYQVAIWWLFKD